MRRQAAQKHFRVRLGAVYLYSSFLSLPKFIFLLRWFCFTEDAKQIPVIPGLSTGVGKMIYAGSIGIQIANELIDSYRFVVRI